MHGNENASRWGTHGGHGWRDRKGDHRQDITEGRRWARCGVCHEADQLRHVLLSVPGGEVAIEGEPDDWLMRARPNAQRMSEQLRGIARVYEAQGVGVSLFQPPTPPPPNHIFMRDLFWMTPEGAVIGRMASEQRAGEERFVALALAELGIPIIGCIRKGGTFEGADALWLSPEAVLLGTGRRTNAEGARQIRALVRELDVEVIEVDLCSRVQHLLGVANPLDERRVAVRSDVAGEKLRGVLGEHGRELIEFSDDAEIVHGRAMNFVTLAPGNVLMPTGCPTTRERLLTEGVTVVEVEVGEYLKAAGGPACLTGIVHRQGS